MNSEFKKMQKAQTKLIVVSGIAKVVTWLALVGGTLFILKYFGII